MNADDPKFTAYALDELEPAERAAIEAELRAQPELAAELEEFRRFTAQLRGELQAEEGAPLLPAQRAAVLGQAPRIVVAGPRAWWRRPWLQSAAAACVIVGLVAAYFGGQAMKAPRVNLDTLEAQNHSVKLAIEPEVAPLQEHTEFFYEAGKTITAAKPAVVPPNPSDVAELAYRERSTEDASQPFFKKGFGLAMKPEEEVRLYATSDPRNPQPNQHVALGTIMEKTRGADALAKEYHRMGEEKPALLALSKGKEDSGVDLADGAAPTSGGVAASGGVSGETAARLKTRGLAAGRNYAGFVANETMSQSERKIAKESLVRKPAAASLSAGVPDVRFGRTDRWAMQTKNPQVEAKLEQLSDDYIRTEQNGATTVPDGFSDKLSLLRSESEARGNTEAYDAITDNEFCTVKDQPLSTFAVDVDTASYANVRRFINANERPPKGAVRIEEMVNYFHYDYPQPEGADAFSCKTEVATCPWQTEHRLTCVGIKGRELKRENRPVANLVFLIDVSGSMQPENKLPLVKQSLGLLIDQLGAEDTVSMAVYAGASGCVLEPTHDREKMRGALERLQAGGSTNGAAGIQLAYDLAQRSFKKGGTNRVILCTDGDFNVGITSQSELVSMIQGKAKTGIFLSVFGFGMGNLKDATLEKLADKGNGNYGYIDTLNEGRKVFVEQMTGTLFTIAKDVKVQVEFNPAQVSAYRLIGYENRLLAKEDFNDDKKDAGEIGAGHTVTALYEIVPAGKEVPNSPVVDDLKYQKATDLGRVLADLGPANKELLTVKVRYKQPDGEVSKKLEFPLTDSGATWEKSSRDFRWAASVASFGLLLRDSPHKGTANWNMTLELATEGKGDDRDGYRSEFVGLVEKAKALSR